MLFVQGVYERHKGIMYRVARAHVREQSEADDAVSDALMRLFRNAGRLRGLSERAIVDYVAEAVHSAAIDNERRRRTERSRLVSADADALEANGFYTMKSAEERRDEERRQELLLARLREALGELSEADRTLLVGKYIDGESDEALAARLGVQTASVRMKLTRARKRARRIIERKGGEDDARQDQQ